MILSRPPPGWKRPRLSVKAKRWIVARQNGKCAETGEPLDGVKVQFDHRPPLWARTFNEATNDTIPPANTPALIDALTVAGHDRRTHGRGGEKRITTRGSDSGERSKETRLLESPYICGLKPERAKVEKKKHQWPTRKLQGKNSFR